MKRIIAFAALVMASCGLVLDSEVPGVYVPVDFKNTYDTIWVFGNGSYRYRRKVYNKNGKLVLDVEHSYRMALGGIGFDTFFLNLDRDLVKFPELIDDFFDYAEFALEKKKGIVQFCTGYDDGEGCYIKLNND